MNNTPTKGGLVVCPHSLEHANFLSRYELHHATPAEIKANGGVCRACRAKFEKHHATALHEPTEPHAEHAEPHRPRHDDELPTFADGAPCQVSQFDFAAIDEALGFVHATPQDARAIAAELIGKLLATIFRPGQSLKQATLKLAVIGSGIRPDLIARSTAEICAESSPRRCTSRRSRR